MARREKDRQQGGPVTTRERELMLQVEDFKDALQAIGRLLRDAAIAPKRRLDQIEGIVTMYGCGVLDSTGKDA